MTQLDDERDTLRAADPAATANDACFAASEPSPESTTATRQMTQAFLDNDYGRALALAERVLGQQPGDVMATTVAKECRAMRNLASSIPVRAVMWDDRVDASADGVAASILSLVDGRANVTEIADIAEASGLGSGEAVRRIEELVETGVLRLVPAGEAVP